MVTKVTLKGSGKKEVAADKIGEQAGGILQLWEYGRGGQGTGAETCCLLDKEHQLTVHACHATFPFLKPLSLLIATHTL